MICSFYQIWEDTPNFRFFRKEDAKIASHFLSPKFFTYDFYIKKHRIKKNTVFGLNNEKLFGFREGYLLDARHCAGVEHGYRRLVRGVRVGINRDYRRDSASVRADFQAAQNGREFF